MPRITGHLHHQTGHNHCQIRKTSPSYWSIRWLLTVPMCLKFINTITRDFYFVELGLPIFFLCRRKTVSLLYTLESYCAFVIVKLISGCQISLSFVMFGQNSITVFYLFIDLILNRTQVLFRSHGDCYMEIFRLLLTRVVFIPVQVIYASIFLY